MKELENTVYAVVERQRSPSAFTTRIWDRFRMRSLISHRGLHDLRFPTSQALLYHRPILQYVGVVEHINDVRTSDRDSTSPLRVIPTSSTGRVQPQVRVYVHVVLVLLQTAYLLLEVVVYAIPNYRLLTLKVLQSSLLLGVELVQNIVQPELLQYPGHFGFRLQVFLQPLQWYQIFLWLSDSNFPELRVYLCDSFPI